MFPLFFSFVLLPRQSTRTVSPSHFKLWFGDIWESSNPENASDKMFILKLGLLKHLK